MLIIRDELDAKALCLRFATDDFDVACELYKEKSHEGVRDDRTDSLDHPSYVTPLDYNDHYLI